MMIRVNRHLLSHVKRRYKGTLVSMNQNPVSNTAAVYKKALSNDKTHFGLFALRNISEGEVIVSEVAKCGQVKPHKYTIQRIPVVADFIQNVVDGSTCDNQTTSQQKDQTPLHLEMDESLLMRYINHSFQPNAVIEFHANELHRVTLRAIAHIREDAEVCFNYRSTESQLAEPFVDLGSGRKVH